MGDKGKRAARGSSSIYKKGVDKATGKPRFKARFTVGGKRHHVRLEATSMEAARAELADRIKAAREGRPYRDKPALPGLTVRALAEKFKAEAQRDVWNLKAYRGAFWSDFKNNAADHIGDKIAVELKRTDIAAWRDTLKTAGKTASSILRGMKVVSVLFNWALELGHLPEHAHNPVLGISKPSYRPMRELYTAAEVVSLLTKASTTSPQLHRMIAFAYFTGCRVGELAALTWGDIDFESHSIHVHRSFARQARKNGRDVTVGLHPHLRDILGPLAGDNDKFVFPDPRDGGMLRKYDSKSECWGLRKLAEAAEVRRLNQPWHSFRASHATALEEAGATPSDIMRALGQSSIQVAMRYAQASPRRAAERVAALPALGPAKASNVTPITAARARRKDPGRTQAVTESEPVAKS